jgi:acetoin utilization deacetylase AcuC-like enzyme
VLSHPIFEHHRAEDPTHPENPRRMQWILGALRRYAAHCDQQIEHVPSSSSSASTSASSSSSASLQSKHAFCDFAECAREASAAELCMAHNAPYVKQTLESLQQLELEGQRWAARVREREAIAMQAAQAKSAFAIDAAEPALFMLPAPPSPSLQPAASTSVSTSTSTSASESASASAAASISAPITGPEPTTVTSSPAVQYASPESTQESLYFAADADALRQPIDLLLNAGNSDEDGMGPAFCRFGADDPLGAGGLAQPLELPCSSSDALAAMDYVKSMAPKEGVDSSLAKKRGGDGGEIDRMPNDQETDNDDDDDEEEDANDENGGGSDAADEDAEPLMMIDCDTFASPQTRCAAVTAVGVVLESVELVLAGKYLTSFAVIRPPGHHAGRDGLVKDCSSQGFCIFNNVAVGALKAKQILDARAASSADAGAGNGGRRKRVLIYGNSHAIWHHRDAFLHSIYSQLNLIFSPLFFVALFSKCLQISTCTTETAPRTFSTSMPTLR